MDRRRLSIPLLCLIAVHIVFGGTRGAAAICFGGHGHEGHGHEHAAAIEIAGDAAATTGHCSHKHDGLLPGPVPADLIGDCCTCTDVTVNLRDLPASVRDADDEATGDDGAAPAPLLARDAEPLTCGRCFRGPPRWSVDDHACRHRLRLVRTTRLII